MRQGWLRRFKQSDAHTQANIVCTVIIAIATVAYAFISARQLIAMRGQLEVMRGTLVEAQRSGEKSTEQMWQAIGNVNWMARTADQSSKETLVQMKAQSLTLQRSANSIVSANRAWIVPDFPPQNKTTIEEANLDWHNAGKTPAISVFGWKEYFTGNFPRQMRTCSEMASLVRKQAFGSKQYQSFVAEGGRYTVGLDHAPGWSGQQPLNIHGCIWYTDISSNTEKSSEFFYLAFQNKNSFPRSEGISVFFAGPFSFK